MLITNAQVITLGKDGGILADGAVLIEDDRIAALGRSQDLLRDYPGVERLDAKNQYVMPGNICAHTHFYGAYARGMAIPGPPPRDFPQILERLWWPLDKALDRESVRSSALVCLLDALKHGATSLVDHHASPNYIAGSLDTIAEAVGQAGLRAVLCYEVTDRDGRDKMEAGINENLRFMKQSADHSRLRGSFGLHASLTLDEASLRKTPGFAALAGDLAALIGELTRAPMAAAA